METNLSIIPQTGMAVMRRNILDQEIEDAVIVEPDVMVEEDHPHFIESNTNEITLEELKNKCVVPVFWGQLINNQPSELYRKSLSGCK